MHFNKLQICGALAIMLCLGLNSCYYDNEEELYPVGTTSCDTSNVRYSTDVRPVLQSNCISCHNSSLESGNVNLEGHANVKAVAEDGRLYGVISHAAGYPPMPQGNPQLPDCQIRKIKSWIDSGSPQN